MKKFILIFSILISPLIIHSQVIVEGDGIANNYYKNGEFQKALLSYKRLLKQKPYSFKFIYRLIDIHQQLKQFQEADSFIRQNLNSLRSPVFLIELGYNYQLQDSLELAKENYDFAIRSLETNPNFVYSLSKKFEDHSLLDEAIKTYNRGNELMPDKNFSIQLARIYGEQGNVELMFTNYLNYIPFQPGFINNAKRAFNDFVYEDSENENNQILRKLLLKKIQEQPDTYWYELLSWLYVQERQYKKSFVQEKALYKRNPESLDRLFELATFALEDKDIDTAETIFDFILETAQDTETQLSAHQYLLEIKSQNADLKDLPLIDKDYQSLFERYGRFENTISLQLSYGNFLAFYYSKPESASNFLKETLDLNITPFQEGLVKLKLGDILILQEKFNEALIYYSQIQMSLKNSTLSQEARYKVAQTSYYKGDFDWAESQLKILKSSTSQLIANDALDLKLLISDNKYEDSTRTALKLYAKADLFSYQKKPKEAIKILDQILIEHKGESITDQALYKQALLFEGLKQYNLAAENYQNIITNYSMDILIDDAYFKLAELYNGVLAEPDEAKELYEKIIFQFEDSIYFIEARKKYRQLRGDAIN